ncbi:MAG: T9SS type A sorting domain-containing protein [Bacteroidota bacterium]
MKTLNVKKLVFLLLLIPFCSSILLAQDRFVDVTGTDAGPNDCSLPGNPCLTIQHAINQSNPGDEIQVSVGIYRENITISQSVILRGSNSGVSGSATRLAETVIQPGSTDLMVGKVITITASDVEIDGFTIGGDNFNLTPPASVFDALQGIYVDATNAVLTNVDIQNNIFEDFPRDNTAAAGNFIDGLGLTLSAAIDIQGSVNGTSGHIIKNNLFRDIDDEPNDDYSDDLGYGIVLRDSAYADISRNKFQNVGAGVLISDIPKSSPTDSLVVDSLFISGGKVGLLVVDGATNLTADSITIVNPVAFGVRLISGNDDINFQMRYSSITGAGSTIPTITLAMTNYSGFASEKYGGTGVQTVRIDSCVISDNKNRGLTFRGSIANSTNIASINNSIIEGNAYDGFATSAFGIIVNRGAEVTINESVLSNSSLNQTATTFDAVLGNNEGNGSVSGIVQVRSCSISATTGILVASSGTGAQMDASSNWWGTTTEATIASSVTGTDFSPWLDSSEDTDPAVAGFQPLERRVNVGLSGEQTGSSERIQEAVTDYTSADTVIIHAGTYPENPTIDRNVTFQTISTVTLDQLTMNGSGVILTLADDLAISSTGSVTLTDGNINVNEGAALQLSNEAVDVTESATSRIEGTVTFTKTLPLESGSGGFSILGVTFVDGVNDIEDLVVSRIAGPQGVNDGSGGGSIGVTWQLTSPTNPDNWSINFSWASIYDNGNGLSTMFIWRDGGSGFAQLLGPISASGDPRVTQDFVINSFSDYTVTDESVTLPVTLADFGVSPAAGNQVNLTWVTLTELNSDFFQIERSAGGVTFSEVGRVAAAGNSTDRIEYQFLDSEVSGEEAFYRLKIVDLDGTFEYSEIRYIQLSGDRPVIYPNPADDYLMIPLGSKLENGIIALYDQAGRKVLHHNITSDRLELSGQRPGVYVYRLKIGNVFQTGKLIIR